MGNPFSPGFLTESTNPGLKGPSFSPGFSSGTKGIPTGTKGGPLAPGEKPGLKEGPFSLGFMLPVRKPGLKGFPNREYSLFLY